jgi:ribosomal-protein-alanine N-acetyltransferase
MTDLTAQELRMSRRKLFSEVPFIKKGRIELRALGLQDEESLSELVRSPRVYRYLPTFLFEKQYEDIRYVISHLYDICMKESIILGIFADGEFCGLAEMYGYRDPIHKISVGYRLLERCWGKGIATEALGIMVDYLYEQTDIEIITASTMIENLASANVLIKNGFSLVVHSALEDWGYAEPTLTDKWIR